MNAGRLLLAAALLIGCGKAVKPPQSPAQSAAAVLDMARARPILDPVRARFNIRLASATLDVNGSTGAGLVIARPAGRLDIFGPLGGSLATFATDGVRVDVLSARDASHLVSDDADQALREITHGAAGITDVLGLLVGDLPFDTARPKGLRRLDDGGVHVTLDGPRGVSIDAILDPALGVPRHVEARDGDGALMLSASYADWAPAYDDGPLAPGALLLHLPLLDLTLELNFRAWKGLDASEVDPAVFSPKAPDSFKVGRLEDALRAAGESLSVPDARP